MPSDTQTAFASIAILAEAAANRIQLGVLARSGESGYTYAALCTNDMLNLPDDLVFEGAHPEYTIEIAERIVASNDPGMKMLALAWLAHHAPGHFPAALATATN